MKNLIIEEVSPQQIKAFARFTEPRIFQTASDIVYPGQIPIVGYLILEGEILLIKNKKIIERVTAGNVFGVVELMNNKPIKYTARIAPNSKVYILDRSTIKEIIQEVEGSYLPQTFRIIYA